MPAPTTDVGEKIRNVVRFRACQGQQALGAWAHSLPSLIESEATDTVRIDLKPRPVGGLDSPADVLGVPSESAKK